jgi:two-component system sensor histidine kinase KdpD
MPASKRDRLLLIGLVAAIVLVIVTTVFEPHPLSGIRDRFVILGILLVSVVAHWRGARTAVLTAVVGFLVIGATQPWARLLSFTSPWDVFADLVIFLAVALIQGMQTGQLRERKEAAEKGRRRMSLVSRLGSRLVPGGARPMLSDLLDELAIEVGASHAALIRADELERSRESDADTPEWLRREPHAYQIVERAMDTRIVVSNSGHQTEGTASVKMPPDGVALPILTAERALGAMYVSRRTDGRPFPKEDLDFLALVSNELASYVERSRLQEEMAETAAQVAGDRLKASLLSSVSHDIRTPLVAATAIISGLAEEQSKASDSRLHVELRSAQDSLELLNRQISDLLDISRLETSSWEPNLDWNDLRDLCAPLLARMPQRLRHRVVCEIPGNLQPMLFDPVQLARALGHILENALAYSDEDSPVKIGGSAEAGRALIWIEDEKKVIFQKFRRGNASSMAPHGTGLGLAIAQEIIGYHGGAIHVEDVQPHGARFVVELPITSEE